MLPIMGGRGGSREPYAVRVQLLLGGWGVKGGSLLQSYDPDAWRIGRATPYNSMGWLISGIEFGH
jgi:hypothetical protein